MKIAIHSGRFHADDVFAVATLKLAGLLTELVRTRDVGIMASCDMRVDVGRKNVSGTGDFDHHQPGGAGERPNGVPYASFGLIWREYGRIVAGSSEVASIIDDQLVQLIDAEDVGYDLFAARLPSVMPYTVGKLIGNFNPSWEESPTPAAMDGRFNAAVEFAVPLLKNEIRKTSDLLEARELTREAIRSGGASPVLILPRHIPSKQTIITEAPEVLYVVSPVWPAVRNQWSIEAIPKTLGLFDLRKPLPTAWAGKEGPALVSASGVEDAVFCHGSGFMAIAESRAGALRLAELAVDD